MYVNYKITPEALPNMGILHVDHEKNFRSGHVGNALVEYKKNCVLSIYSNCSATRNQGSPGHNGFGWVEYKRSTDGGLTWGEAKILDYSYDAFINQPFTVSCRNAISTKENEIILFGQRNLEANGWAPLLEPVVLKSEDGGETWSQPTLVCDKRGAVLDAIVHEGVIYAMVEELESSEESKITFYLYKSTDGGATFSLVSQIPASTGDYYGELEFLDDGALICYMYVMADEYHLRYHLSYDMGVTWAETGNSYVAKRIRNPQIAKVKGGYILHGRAGQQKELPSDFVIYTSKDGLNWDEGVYITNAPSPKAYYSNNVVLDLDDGSQRVLIQSSVPYDGWARVNIALWILDIE